MLKFTLRNHKILINGTLNKLIIRMSKIESPYKHYSYSKVKRTADIIFSSSIILALFPFFLLIALIIKASSKGPIFYKHERLGIKGKKFQCLKFRTMFVNSDKHLEEILNKNEDLKKEFAESFKLKNDPRITPFGKILRKTSCDELPQFFNVLKGEMSIVGPRPIVEKELSRYGDKKDYLLSISPGITGLWQVNGRSYLAYSHRKNLDLYYVKNRGLRLDLLIFLKTIIVIIFPFKGGAF